MFKTFLAVSWEGRGVKRNRSGDLKEEKRGKSEINKKELDLKIAKYKIYYNECIHISNHLMDRYYGV